ncbi:hypothetical protein EDM21_07235 [Paenibacillus sp. N10]|uniref:Accessory regulator AgrB n=2 Tax=Paenibacillus lutrae TaxID=2078573 RepID=A0A7X3FGJ4_9BACL|nr:hypothetical protein [Paenibacillus lutrae]
MSMTEKIIGFVESNADNPESTAILKYGLRIAMETAAVVIPVIILSIITGQFLEGLVSTAGFLILRYLSGGMHFKKASTCNIISIIILIISISIPVPFDNVGCIMTVVAAIILFFTTPSNTNRRRLDPKYDPLLKVIAAGIVSINFIAESSVLSLTFFIQALTTLPIFWKLLDTYQN